MENKKLLKNTIVSLILMCVIFMSIASDLATARVVRVTKTKEECEARCHHSCNQLGPIKSDICLNDCLPDCPPTNTLPTSREHITQTREQCKAACNKWCLHFSGLEREVCFSECIAQCPGS